MPLDAITLRATVLELSALKGARIEKIYQPEHLILVLSVRGNQKLLISAGAAPRICLTNDKPENPANPPMFCMLLRKHLTGAKIRNIIQPGLERVVQIEFDTTDEMGDPSKKMLTAELFGRQANIIMQDADGRIIDCLRRVDISMSEERQILPGMFYRLPKTAGR
ncbi:MAG: NFACT family protein, partial [Bacillota bacterium]|nr:NFACT family protein [Bacillota bacterium]